MASNRDDSSLEDVAVLSSTRAFAQDALLQFQLGKFNKCLTALQEFLKRKANNPKNPKAAISAPKPSWFSPERLLLILCLDNLIKRGDFKLNNFQDGVLSFAFMVGPLVALPIFASLGKRLVGVGEASLIILAAPFIDDHAPADQASNLLLRLKCKGWSSSSQVSSEIILKKKLELEDKLLDAPPDTLGAAALALHYASVGKR